MRNKRQHHHLLHHFLGSMKNERCKTGRTKRDVAASCACFPCANVVAVRVCALVCCASVPSLSCLSSAISPWRPADWYSRLRCPVTHSVLCAAACVHACVATLREFIPPANFTQPLTIMPTFWVVAKNNDLPVCCRCFLGGYFFFREATGWTLIWPEPVEFSLHIFLTTWLSFFLSSRAGCAVLKMWLLKIGSMQPNAKWLCLIAIKSCMLLCEHVWTSQDR